MAIDSAGKRWAFLKWAGAPSAHALLLDPDTSGLSALERATVLGYYAGNAWDAAAVNTSARYHVVRQSTPGSAGNETISGIPFDPTACMVTYAGGVSSADTGVAHVCEGIGFSDGSNQYADSTWDEDNVTTSNPHRYNSDEQVVYAGIGAAADAKCEAVGTGLGPGTGEWVFNWSSVPATAGMVTYEFFSCPAQVNYQLLGTGTSAINVDTTGMTPDCVFMSQVGWNNIPNNPMFTDRMFRVFGIAIYTGSITQRGFCTSSVLAGSNSTITTIAWDDRISGQANNDAEDYSVEVTELGVNERFVITPRAESDTDASNDYVGYLALDTGTSLYLATATLPTNTSLWTYNSIGFEPAGVKMFGASIESADVNAVQTASPETDTVFVTGTDGVTGGGMWQSDLDDFFNAGGSTNTATGAPGGLLTYADEGGTIQYQIPTPTFDSNGFTVTPTTAVSTPTRVAFLFAMGEDSNALTIEPAGGITFAGDPASVYARVHDVAGGVTFAGAPASVYKRTELAAGGIVFAGVADLTTGFVLTVSGGLVFAGDTPFTYVRNETPVGGIVFGGESAQSVTSAFDVAGGIVFAGDAAFETTVPSLTITPMGGIVFGGGASGTLFQADADCIFSRVMCRPIGDDVPYPVVYIHPRYC